MEKKQLTIYLDLDTVKKAANIAKVRLDKDMFIKTNDVIADAVEFYIKNAKKEKKEK